MMIYNRLHTAVGQMQCEASDREVESVFLTYYKMKSKIPVLMELYMKMTEANKKAKIEYQRDKEKHSDVKYYYPSFSERPYSDTMLHSIIVIINRLNNSK